jgi:carbamoyl-phosphate synthase large subunit
VEKINILVTGMGALIGQGIARSLRVDGRSNIVGLDRHASLYGASLCDKYLAKPDCSENSEEYIAFWLDLLQKHKIDLVLPGISIDMSFLNSHRDVLIKSGARLGLNAPELINLTHDKMVFHESLGVLKAFRIPSAQPKSWAEALKQLGSPPFIFKPRIGEGSQGQAVLNNETDFIYWVGRIGSQNWMLQPFIGTDEEEYTVGAFGLGGGKFVDEMIVMRRRLTRAGNTGKAVVVDHPNIVEASRKILNHFHSEGPTNLQFRCQGENVYLLEINPRFSSSSSLRSAFGYNEAAMSIDHYLLGIYPKAATIRPGRAERFMQDYVIYAGSHF